jgi:hypothetical protein
MKYNMVLADRFVSSTLIFIDGGKLESETCKLPTELISQLSYRQDN